MYHQFFKYEIRNTKNTDVSNSERRNFAHPLQTFDIISHENVLFLLYLVFVYYFIIRSRHAARRNKQFTKMFSLLVSKGKDSKFHYWRIQTKSPRPSSNWRPHVENSCWPAPREHARWGSRWVPVFLPEILYWQSFPSKKLAANFIRIFNFV